MKSPAHALALLLALGFVWGVIHLFDMEFAVGGVYPRYSSLRSDPDGAKLLYESLALIPGIRVSRNYLPLETLAGEGQTILLLGISPSDLAERAPVLKQIAERGNRVVAAMSPMKVPDGLLLASWGVVLDPADRLAFASAEGWIEMQRDRGKLTAIERAFGKGSVALLTTSANFTNESTVSASALPLVTRTLGHPQRIVFDESHLGIAESGSVVALARRMRLTGLALGLAICAALWIWRASSAFPPPLAAPARDRLAGRTSHAGLLTLLRRNIAPRDLAAVCWQQWLSFNRTKITPARAERARAASEHRDPVAAAREIQTAIHAKGQS